MRVNPRLVDVAKVAGVSRGTASNVFAHPERVREGVREKVLEAAHALGYSGPDPRARLLRAGKINAIGIVSLAKLGIVDSLRNPVFRQFLIGVGEVCDERGANFVIIPDRPGSGGVRNALVDGFIFARVDQLAEIEPARLRRLPYVVMEVDAGPHISSVHTDARAGAYASAKHLIGLGHRRFGILSFLRDFGPLKYYPPGEPRSPDAAGMLIDQEKLAGYADAFAEAGIAIDAVPIVQAHAWDTDAAKTMLDVAPDATAILSMSVMQAIAVLDEARRRGLLVPRDLSVVGFNDIPEASNCTPPLTTVDGMSAEKGRVAARLVFAAGQAQHEVLQTNLIIRASTAPPSR